MAINTDSMTKQIYDVIKKDILEHRILPGEKVDTKNIAKANNISVMPVRTALRQLTTDGLLIDRERVGFFVRRYSADEIRQIMEMRIMFELHCLKNHITSIDKARVAEIADRLSGPVLKQELNNLDDEMHQLIVLSSNNQFIINEYTKLSALFTMCIYSETRETLNAAKEEHCNILKAILSDDTKTAIDLLETHLLRTREEVARLYPSKLEKSEHA